MSTAESGEHSFEVVESHNQAGRARLSVRGELDLATAAELDGALHRVSPSGVRSVVLDMTDVGFMDSSGLRVLVRWSNDIRAHEGSLEIDGMSAAVHRVLDVTGLLGQLTGQDDHSAEG